MSISFAHLSDLIDKAYTQQSHSIVCEAGRVPTMSGPNGLTDLKCGALSYENISIWVNELNLGLRARVHVLKHCRVAWYAIQDNEGLCLMAGRLHPLQPLTLQDCMLPNRLEHVLLNQHGLTLITGGNGSGKSTLASALVHHVAQHEEVGVYVEVEEISLKHKNILAQKVNPKPTRVSLYETWTTNEETVAMLQHASQEAQVIHTLIAPSAAMGLEMLHRDTMSALEPHQAWRQLIDGVGAVVHLAPQKGPQGIVRLYEYVVMDTEARDFCWEHRHLDPRVVFEALVRHLGHPLELAVANAQHLGLLMK